MYNKKMIVLEGIAGAGKSTNINMLKNKFDNIDGINIKISKLLENIEKTNFIDYNNTDYYLLLDNLKTILYNDSKKKIVLFERYYLSTLAHSYALSKLKKDDELYYKVFYWYKENIGKSINKPNAYIFLKIPIDIAIQRIEKRNENVVNKIWIKKEYLKLCEEYKRNFVNEYESDVKSYIVDSTMNLEDVNNKIYECIKEINKNECNCER